jgi:hypothetical protein
MGFMPESWFTPRRPTRWWEPEKLPGDEQFPILKFLGNADQRIFRRYGGLRKLLTLLLFTAGLLLLTLSSSWAIGALGAIPIALGLFVWLTKINWRTVYGSGPPPRRRSGG